VGSAIEGHDDLVLLNFDDAADIEKVAENGFRENGARRSNGCIQGSTL